MSLLRIQACTFCNLNCSYCYIPASSRRAKQIIAPEVLRQLFERLRDENLLGPSLTISWHGAEPLTAGVAFYRAAFELAEELLGPLTKITHVFQSNGALIDDAWCDLFQSARCEVGVSLDGSRAQSSERVNWAGQAAYDQVMSGIAMLNERGIPWTLLAVVGDTNVDDPQAFCDFVQRTGCKTLGIKAEQISIANQRGFVTAQNAQARYARFLTTLYHQLHETGAVTVREFSAARLKHMLEDTVQKIPVTMVPFRNLTVAVNGDFTVFSGELLFHESGQFVLGNVRDGPLLDCLTTPTFRRLGDKILHGAEKCRASCPEYLSCGSFFIAQKFSEFGTFDVAETQACALEFLTLKRVVQDLGVAAAP